MFKAIGAAVAAAVLTFTGTQVAGGPSEPGSSPERTVFSAVHALKHKNFGRFCSYLSDELRGASGDCAAGNAAGWGQNAILIGLDIFDAGSKVVPGYRAQVDDETVTYLVNFPALEADGYYRVTVVLQASGKWRITAIDSVTDLPAEAARAASYGVPAAVDG